MNMKKSLLLLAILSSTSIPTNVNAGDPLTLNWNRNPEDTQSGKIDCTLNDNCFGYTVWFGTSETTVKLRYASIVNTSYTLDADKLLVNIDRRACFGVTAFNKTNQSMMSDIVCTTLRPKGIKPTKPINLTIKY